MWYICVDRLYGKTKGRDQRLMLVIFFDQYLVRQVLTEPGTFQLVELARLAPGIPGIYLLSAGIIGRSSMWVLKQFQKGQETQTDISQKKTCKWPTVSAGEMEVKTRMNYTT